MLGTKLKELRKKRNLTQQELAEILKVTPGAIGLWEIGRREPDYKTLMILAQYFNVSVDYLLNKEEKNKIVIIGSNGSYKTFYLSEKDLHTLENLAESLDSNDTN